MTSTHSSPPVRPRVGDYELIVKIGEGGMGVVHLARRPGEDRVALKVLRPHVVGDEEARARLAREVSSLGRIRSRWVAEIVDADPWAEVPYVATRYVPGLSLHDHVLEDGKVTGRDLTWFAGCLAEGLASVHAAGVLHRDVKPSNVLMEGRTPILIDFGLARVADDPKLTHTGWLLGTPGYLAPEILHGDEPTPAADVHSWAATVAYAATGAPPFGRGPAMAIMDRVRRGQHALDDHPDLAEPLRSVVVAALDPEPAERPDLASLLDWLRPQSTRPHDRPVPPPLGPSGRDAWVGLDADLDPDAGPDGGDGGAGWTHETAPVGLHHWQEDTTLRGGPDPDDAHDTRVLTAVDDRGAPGRDDTWLPGAWQDAPPPARQDDRDDHDDRDGRYDARSSDRSDGRWDDRWDERDPEQVWEPWQPPRATAAERARRGSLLLLTGAAVAAAVAAFPWLATIASLLVVWVLRSGSAARSRVADRRLRRGRSSWWEGPALVLGSPLHLLRGLPSTIGLALVAGALAASAGLVAVAVTGEMPRALAVAGAALALALWWGPGASRVRGPVGSVVRPLAHRVPVWLLAVVLVGGVAAGLAALASAGPDWTPGGAPSLTDPIGSLGGRP